MEELLSVLAPDGTLSIWYTSRLRELTAALPREWVRVDSLADLDENLWFNTYGEEPTCRAVAMHARRIMEADLEYPVILSPDGLVMDGMHRLAKAWILGKTEILAIRFPAWPPADEVMPNYEAAGAR